MNEKKETIEDILDGLLSKDSVESLAAIDSAETIRILLGHVASRIKAAAERERRKYERLHECFWSDGAIQNIVRQLLDERDDLRDLVKRMIPFVEKCHSDALDLSKTIKGICALKGVDTSEIDRINSEHDALIADARAAIGEDKP